MMLLHIYNWNPISLLIHFPSFLSPGSIELPSQNRRLPASRDDASAADVLWQLAIRVCCDSDDGGVIAGPVYCELLHPKSHLLSFNLFICLMQDQEELSKTTRQYESLSARRTLCSSA
jgi:hypothetical protein